MKKTILGLTCFLLSCGGFAMDVKMDKGNLDITFSSVSKITYEIIEADGCKTNVREIDSEVSFSHDGFCQKGNTVKVILPFSSYSINLFAGVVTLSSAKNITNFDFVKATVQNGIIENSKVTGTKEKINDYAGESFVYKNSKNKKDLNLIVNLNSGLIKI